MNIREISGLVGVSAHTLRYYEKIGLLKEVRRNSSGHRFYTSRDLEWVKFIVRLKETGMQLEKITAYADLRELGDSTLQQRQKLLEEHRIRLNSVIESQLNHLKALDQKITYYKEKISS